MTTAVAVKRASFLPENLKEGGGNFFGANGPARATLIKGRFTKEAPDGYTASGNPIFAVIDLKAANVVREEGQSDEDYEAATRVNQSYSCGAQSGDNFTISEDGDYLIPNTGDAQIVKDSKFGTLVMSFAAEKGIPREFLSDFAWSKFLGMDGDWKRVLDKARDFGEQPGRQKPKFPPATLCLVKLHAISGKVNTASAPTVKAGPLSAPATSGNPTAGETLTGEELDAAVWPYLERVLQAAKGHTEQRARLTLAVSKMVNADGPNINRAAIASRAASEAYIQTLVDAGMVTYGKDEKGQPVTLAS